MYALDNKSGIQQMPEIPEVFSTTPLWFTEGRDGNAPSYPGAHWFNIIQAELLNVLKEAGIEPDKHSLDQLAQALKIRAGQVESIADLRQFEPVKDRQVAFVKGYYAGSNKGGGYFVANFGDSTTADNDGTVIVTAGGKRWKRIAAELTPYDFGAKAGEDSTQAFLRAKNFKLNLLDEQFTTGYIHPNVKNGKLSLNKDAISDTDILHFDCVHISSNATGTVKNFRDANLVINSGQNTATLTLNVGGFDVGRTVLITTSNFVATALTESANSYAPVLAKGLWLVQSSSETQSVLTRNIKAKREAVLNVSSTISGSAKQLGTFVALSQNTKVLGSTFTVEGVEFNSKQITFEDVSATLNSIHIQEGVILINSKVNGAIHSMNATSSGISIYNSIVRIGSSTVVSPATNGIIATQASNVMCEYAAVFDAGNSGIYAHTASTIEARFASACFCGKSGSSGSVGTGFESESASSLFCERSCAIANDSYGYYANATSQMACASCSSLSNYHGYYCLSATMFARYSLSLNPRYRGFYAYLNADINALDTTASGARDYDYCVQGGSVITVLGYKDQASKFSTALNLNGANKILSSNLLDLNNYQTFSRGESLNIESNAITVTSDLHIIATAGTVSTINGRATDGALLQLRNLSSRSPVTLNSTGNIILKGGEVKLSSYVDRILLTYDLAAKKWVELSRTEYKDEYETYIRGSNLTIHSGAITVQTDYHIIDGADHSQLSTINGRASDGALLHLRGLSDANPVTVTNTGNIYLRNGDCVLSGFRDRLTLMFDNTINKWTEVSRNNSVKESLTMPGWRKDGEFIMQWGSGTIPENSNSVHVSFPVAFNTFLFAIPIDVTSGGRVETLAINNPTNTGMTIQGKTYAGVVRYVAYGR